MWQNYILRYLKTSCFQALIQSRVSENSTITFFTIGSYVHSYKFKICVHNSLQNNGMALSAVKILAAGVRRAMNSDVLASILSMQFGKFQRILKSFGNFCKYFIFWRRHISCLWCGSYGTGCLDILSFTLQLLLIV